MEENKGLPRVTVYLDPEVKQALDQYKRKGIPYSHLVNEALGIHLEEVMAGKREIIEYEEIG